MEEEKQMTTEWTAKLTENMKGGLWLTTMGRIVLDDHNNEMFSEPGDTKLMTAEELTMGISLKEFDERLLRLRILRRLK